MDSADKEQSKDQNDSVDNSQIGVENDSQKRIINDIVVTPSEVTSQPTIGSVTSSVEEAGQNTDGAVVAEPMYVTEQKISPLTANDAVTKDAVDVADSHGAVSSSVSSEQNNTSGTMLPRDSSIPKGPNKVLLALAALLFLSALGASAWFFLSKKDTKNSTSKVTNADTKTPELVKKTIPFISQVGTEGPLNVFPPKYVSNNGGIQVARQLFESLVAFEDTNTIKPQLAESWSSPDTSTWVFKLKKGVKFHTGRVMTAEDIKGSLESAKKTAGYEVYTNTIKSIEVVDENTIKITTMQPDAILLSRLSFVFIYDTKSDKKDDPNIGSGAYIVKAGTIPTENTIQMVAFDDYHGGKPLVRELSFKVSNNQDIVKESATTKYDFVYGLTKDSIKTLQDNQKDYIKSTVSSSSSQNLFLNVLKGGPLASKDVRRAILLTIDPVKNIEASGVEAVQADQVVSKDIPGFSSTYKRPVKNIEEAKALLKKAGYEKGFTINLSYGGANKPNAEDLKSQLAEVGIVLNLKQYTDPSSYFKDTQEGKADSFLTSYSSDINDLSDVVSAVFQTGNLYNTYKNKDVDAALALANAEFDPAKRLKLLEKVSDILLEDVASIPIRSRINTLLTSNINYQFKFDYPSESVPAVYYWKIFEKQ